MSDNITVKPFSTHNFIAINILLSKYYSASDMIMLEMSMANKGSAVYVDNILVGCVLIVDNLPLFRYPYVLKCIVEEQYKNTAVSYKILREMKRLLEGRSYYINYENDKNQYLGKTDSVKHIVDTKTTVVHGGCMSLIYNSQLKLEE